MCAQRDEESNHSLSIGSVDSEQESFLEVADSDEEVTTERRSSDDGDLTLTRSSTSDSHVSTPSSSGQTPPSTAPTTASSSGRRPHQNQRQQQQRQQHLTTRRTSRASSAARVANRNSRSRRSKLPLREVVARRAFECAVGAHGELSKVAELVGEGNIAALEVGEPTAESEDGSEKAPGHHHRRHSHGRPPSSEFELESIPYGADIYVGHKDTSKCFWGVDLHWCDLESFTGFPAELGSSPWDSDAEGDEEPWLCVCVHLDASLNRLRGIDVIADQPSLQEVAYLDISHNLIDDLDSVQDLPNLQVLMVSNNQVDSVQPLGELRKGSGLRHVDLSNNCIPVVEAPQSAHAFRRLKTLSLSSNHLESFEEEAALALTSLERLDVSDNELVSIDWVALLEALRFLDCSANQVSDLTTFARALADPPRLAEVVAEGNPVTAEPQYRIIILTKCKKIKRLDHRPVDTAALKRQLRCASETKVLASVRETASEEYHLSVEGERSRLRRRKSVLKAQERQLDAAFQGYRAQKQREMGECVAYAQSLRGKDGQVLTPKVAHVFQDAVEDRRSAKERDKDKGGASRGAEGSSDVERSLKNVLREAVGKEHPEFSSSSGGSSYDSELSTGDDEDDGSRGSDFSWSSGDAERGTIDSTSSTSSTTRRKRRRRKAGTTDRSGGSSGFSTPISSSGQEESHEERRKGGGKECRGVIRGQRGQGKRPQGRANRAAASRQKEAGSKERPDRSSNFAVDAPAKKTGGGGIVRSVLGAIGWRKTAGSNSNSNASLATAGSASHKTKG